MSSLKSDTEVVTAILYSFDRKYRVTLICLFLGSVFIGQKAAIVRLEIR
jgi:hypothetical protein